MLHDEKYWKEFDRKWAKIQKEIENPVSWKVMLFLLWFFSPFVIGVVLALMNLYLY